MPRKTARVPENKIDRDALHLYAMRIANHRGRARISHASLADELGIRSDHMGRILQEMVAAGRMRRISSSNEGVVYAIKDFDVWAKETGYQKPRQRRGA